MILKYFSGWPISLNDIPYKDVSLSVRDIFIILKWGGMNGYKMGKIRKKYASEYICRFLNDNQGRF